MFPVESAFYDEGLVRAQVSRHECLTLQHPVCAVQTLTTEWGYANPAPASDRNHDILKSSLHLLVMLLVLRRPSTNFARSRLMSTVRLTNRPLDWKAAAPDSLGITPGSLPKLPVPELNKTLARLKETLKPIAWSNEEYSTAEKKIDDCALNKGPELQKRLLESSKLTHHWLEQWWDDGAYLGYRDSVIYISVSNVNLND